MITNNNNKGEQDSYISKYISKYIYIYIYIYITKWLNNNIMKGNGREEINHKYIC